VVCLPSSQLRSAIKELERLDTQDSVVIVQDAMINNLKEQVRQRDTVIAVGRKVESLLQENATSAQNMYSELWVQQEALNRKLERKDRWVRFYRTTTVVLLGVVTVGYLLVR